MGALKGSVGPPAPPGKALDASDEDPPGSAMHRRGGGGPPAAGADMREPNVYLREMILEDLPKVFALGEKLFTAESWPNLYRTWDEYEPVEFFASEGETCLVAEDEDSEPAAGLRPGHGDREAAQRLDLRLPGVAGGGARRPASGGGQPAHREAHRDLHRARGPDDAGGHRRRERGGPDLLRPPRLRPPAKPRLPHQEPHRAPGLQAAPGGAAGAPATCRRPPGWPAPRGWGRHRRRGDDAG